MVLNIRWIWMGWVRRSARMPWRGWWRRVVMHDDCIISSMATWMDKRWNNRRISQWQSCFPPLFFVQFIGKVITERIDMSCKPSDEMTDVPRPLTVVLFLSLCGPRISPPYLWESFMNFLRGTVIHCESDRRLKQYRNFNILHAPSTVQLGSPGVHRRRHASCWTRYGPGIDVHCWSLRFLAHRRNQGLLRTRSFKINGRSSVRWSWHSKILSGANAQCCDLFLSLFVNVLCIDRPFINDPVP